jgi:hypothetical protein
MIRLSPHVFPLLFVALSIGLPGFAQAQSAVHASSRQGKMAQVAAPAIQPGQNGSVSPVVAPDAQPVATVAEPPQPSTPPAPTLSDLGKSLRTYFTEEELSLLFQYMKESVMASFKDEEVSLPPDIAFKLEILLVRLKKEGGHYMDNLINQLEKDLKNNLKEKLKETLTPPPIKDQPYNPWLSKPWE